MDEFIANILQKLSIILMHFYFARIPVHCSLSTNIPKLAKSARKLFRQQRLNMCVCDEKRHRKIGALYRHHSNRMELVQCEVWVVWHVICNRQRWQRQWLWSRVFYRNSIFGVIRNFYCVIKIWTSRKRLVFMVRIINNNGIHVK